MAERSVTGAALDADIRGQSVDGDALDQGVFPYDAWDFTPDDTAPVLELRDPWKLVTTILSAVPPGVVFPYAGSSAPSGGFLLCDGSAVSRSTYARLYAVIGTTYGTGDGSTTFNVPDMREAYPVGVGTRAAGVTAHDAFTLAQFKDDQLQGHKHNQRYQTVSNRDPGTGNWYSVASSTTSDGDPTTVPVTDSVNGTPRTGTTTRGKGLGLNFIIKT